jgi:hypothetical protein
MVMSPAVIRMTLLARASSNLPDQTEMKALKLRNLALPSNELLSVNMLHERTLHSRSRTSEKCFWSAYRVYSASTNNILRWVCEV